MKILFAHLEDTGFISDILIPPTELLQLTLMWERRKENEKEHRKTDGRK